MGRFVRHPFCAKFGIEGYPKENIKTPSEACRRPADINLSTTDDFLLDFHTFDQVDVLILQGIFKGNFAITQDISIHRQKLKVLCCRPGDFK